MEEPHGGSSAYASEHIVPEPIEMPPAKTQPMDVSEVLASVQGSFNFVQDSMVVQDAMVDYNECKRTYLLLANIVLFIDKRFMRQKFDFIAHIVAVVLQH